jgi:hypothetical protein
VDFIRGNDGNGNPRRWALGSIVNSTPGIIGPPLTWKQFPVHSTFETAYISRATVAWAGSSDGALHAFDVNDGAELVALIPPDELDLQVKLYNNFAYGLAHPSSPSPMGEATLPQDHLYGVANSPRFADIYDANIGEYRTVLFIGEGPGGTGLHALDVTHPTGPRTYADGTTYVGDANFAYGHNGACTGSSIPSNPVAAEALCAPVLPLWSVTKDGKAGTSALADLAETWSVPAVGGEAGGTSWELVMGNGYVKYDAANGATTDPRPHYLRFDPLTGTVRSNDTVSNFSTDQTAGGPWLRNQAFADTSIWSTVAGYFQPDNDVNQGVQLDLQGHIWLASRPSFAATNWSSPVAMADSSSQVAGDPLYYAAAIAEFPAQSPTYNLFAFSSGTFYEKSAYVMGANVGIDAVPPATPNFIPGLFLVTRTNEAVPTTLIRKINIRDIPVTETITNPDGTTSTITHNLGHRTQATSPPDIFVPNPGTQGKVAAVFLLFDPDASCAGRSYVVMVQFDPGMLPSTNPVIDPTGGTASDSTVKVKTAYAGEGAASGMAIAGTMPVVAKSFAGTGGTGYFYLVEGLPISGAGGAGAPISWWAELPCD